MYEDSAIVRFYSYLDGSNKLMRIRYSLSENEVTLGDIREVHVTYEDIEEQQDVNQATIIETPVEEPTDEPQGVTNPESLTIENTVAEISTESVSEVEDAVSEAVETTEEHFAENEPESAIEETSETDAAAIAANEETADFAAQDVDANTQTTMEVGAVNEQKQEENSSSAPLTDSERAEFEALKRAQKEELLDSYKEYLSNDEYNGFFATIDSVSKEELEISLLKAYKDFQERENAKPVTRVFSLSQLIGNNLKKNESKESELANYIGEILHR